MGRRKGSKNKKPTKGANKVNKQAPNKDLIGGIVIIISLIMFVFTFSSAGSLGHLINEVFTGLFGISRYIVPFIFLYIGAALVVYDEVNVGRKIMQGLFLSLLVSSLAYVFTTNEYLNVADIVESSKSAYMQSIEKMNMGGVIGSISTSFIYNLFGDFATKILLVSTTILTVLFAFNISLRQLILWVTSLFTDLGDNVKSNVNDMVKDAREVKEARKVAREVVKENERNIEPKVQPEKTNIMDLMRENGSKNVEKHLKVSKNEPQIVFDLDNLGNDEELFKKEKEEKKEKIQEVLQLEHIKHAEDQGYKFPSLSLLKNNTAKDQGIDKNEIKEITLKLQNTLQSFGVDAKVTHVTKGPTVTRYELTPSVGVKVKQIENLANDIALVLAAKSIRIEAPIPGKAAVGIEVPNKKNESVFLKDVITSNEFMDHKSKICFGLGKDASGEYVVGDIAKMPHVLIAGSTGSGKSVCINSIIVSILYKAKPSEVKLILIDPKMVELSGYNGIPHLLIPVVTDSKKASGALNWAVQEMENRYSLFASKGVKDIKGYNQLMEKEAKLHKDEATENAKLPQIVIIIDELADLMMVASKEVEEAICRIAQKARAAGMHLIIATQRPSVNVVTGVIKANIPSRIAFTVASQVDSRTILDMQGAEKLLGKGDMLYFPTGLTKPQRVQGTFISENEIERVVEDIKSNSTASYDDKIIEKIEREALGKDKENPVSDEESKDADSLLNEAMDLVVSMGQASASMLQRRFKIGYARAGRIIDQMEERGLISGYEGSKPRKLLITKEEWEELKLSSDE